MPGNGARSVISTQTFRRAPTASVDSRRGDKECPFSGVTKSGRVWKKVPENDARSVGRFHTQKIKLSSPRPYRFDASASSVIPEL